MNNIGKRLAVITSIVITLWSCSMEDMISPTEVGDKSIETVNLSINIPVGGEKQTTRALSETGEMNVVDVDILQFTHDGGKYAYRATGNNLSGSGKTRTFSARLLKGTYDLVIIVNARTQVNDLIYGTNGVTKADENTAIQDALNRLSITITATDKITVNAVPALPMFGFLQQALIESGNSLNVSLVRMLAKINVALSDAVINSGNFQLANARLYNQALKGWIAPEFSSWPANNISATAWYGGATEPTKASYTAATPNDPILYSGVSDNVTNDSITYSIYTFEAPAGSEAAYTSNTCLVVGGYYNGSTTMSYYRVDFRHLAGDSYLPLLRNHEYNVIVRSVTGPGYPTPDDAFHNSAHLTAEILDWNLAQENIIVDGQYFINVNTDLIELKGSGKLSKQLTAETNYSITYQGFPAGLLLEETEIQWVSGDSAWLTITDLTGTNGSMIRTLDLKASKDTTFLALRKAILKLHAGNMTKLITVTQTPMGALAAPGVLGYTEETHELTLRGSEEYSVNPDIAEAAEIMFPGQGLHDQTVYVAYAKWGSLVLTGSEVSGTFTPNEIVYAPADYKNAGSVAAALRMVKNDVGNNYGLVPFRSGNDALTNGWLAEPEKGLGDPCAYYFGGDGWYMPSGGKWDPEDNYPFGTDYTSYNNYWVEASMVGEGLPGGSLSLNGWSMFLPVTGMRNLNGNGGMGIPASGINSYTVGYYWSATPYSSSDGLGLEHQRNQLNTYLRQVFVSSLAIRCIQ